MVDEYKIGDIDFEIDIMKQICSSINSTMIIPTSKYGLHKFLLRHIVSHSRKKALIWGRYIRIITLKTDHWCEWSPSQTEEELDIGLCPSGILYALSSCQHFIIRHRHEKQD